MAQDPRSRREEKEGERMRYQILYTYGGVPIVGALSNVCGCEYVTARTHMEARCKGEALAVGYERVAQVIPLND
jgi:hypothetical protein